MRITLLSIFLIVIFLMLSCATSDSDYNQVNDNRNSLDVSIYEIDVEEAGTMKISDLFEKLEFVRLETTDSFLVDEIKKLIVHDDLILIHSADILFIFNSTGKIVRKIDKKGKGPDEYISLSNFLYDPENQTIEILDGPSETIKYYNLSGNMTGELFLGFDVQDFVKLQKHYLFYCGNQLGDMNRHKLVYFDVESKRIIQQYIPIDPNISAYLHINDIANFEIFNGHISFWHSLNDTIYHVTREKIYPRIIIDVGEKNIPEEFFQKEYPSIVQFASELTNSDYIYGTVNFLEFQSFILFGVRQKNKLYHVFFQKDLDRIIIADSIHFDLLADELIEPTNYNNLPIQRDKNSAYYVINLFEFIPKLDSIRKALNDDQWNEIIENSPFIRDISQRAKLYDNPYLLIFN